MTRVPVCLGNVVFKRYAGGSLLSTKYPSMLDTNTLFGCAVHGKDNGLIVKTMLQPKM